MEILRFRRLTGLPFWYPLKVSLSVLGSIGTGFALLTGDPAEHLLRQTHPELRRLIQTHSAWADVATLIYAVIAALYLMDVVYRESILEKILSGLEKASWYAPLVQFKNYLAGIARKIIMSPLMSVLAVIGFAALSIVGALGGAIVYGPNADPIVSLIYKILGPF